MNKPAFQRINLVCWLAMLYAAASFIHHVHNAAYLATKRDRTGHQL